MDGTLVGAAYKEYPCYYPKSSWVEQKPEDMVPAIFATAKEAIAKAGIDAKDILAVSLSTQGGTFGLSGADGKLLRPFLVWQDLRGAEYIPELKKSIDLQKHYAITGDPYSYLLANSKIEWLRRNEPENFGKTALFVDVMTYFLKALGMKENLTDSSSAMRMGVCDIDNNKWSKECADLIGVSIDKLAEIVEPGTVVGKITAEVAAQTGFAEGTPICMGSMDCTASTFGCGGTDDGMSLIVMGTYGSVFSISAKPIRDPNCNMMVKENSGMGNYTIEANSNTSASSYRWYRDVFCATETAAAGLTKEDAYDLINKQIASVPPGANGVTFLPYLQGRSGEQINEKARGNFIGMSLGSTKADIARSVMEGISFETYDTINAQNAIGLKIDNVRLTGGAAKSPLWRQMLSDIFKMPVQLLEVSESGALGAAMYAGVGAGVYKDCRDAAKKAVRLGILHTPNPDNYNAYDEAYARYKSVYDALTLGKVW